MRFISLILVLLVPFAIATEHAPKLKLIYNQPTALEAVSMEKVKKTILYLREKGLRVDGLGWQGQLRYGWHKSPSKLAYLSELSFNRTRQMA